MSAWSYDEIENAQHAWAVAREANPIDEQAVAAAEHRPTRPIMEGRGPQMPKAKTS